jgi:hypothetical protein
VAEEDGNESSDKINSQSTTTDSNAAEQQGGGAWAIINHKPAGQQGHLMQVRDSMLEVDSVAHRAGYMYQSP